MAKGLAGRPLQVCRSICHRIAEERHAPLCFAKPAVATGPTAAPRRSSHSVEAVSKPFENHK